MKELEKRTKITKLQNADGIPYKNQIYPWNKQGFWINEIFLLPSRI